MTLQISSNIQVEFKQGSVFVNGTRVFAIGVAARYFYELDPTTCNENCRILSNLVRQHGTPWNKKRFAIFAIK